MIRVLVTAILSSLVLVSDATAQPQIALSTSVATPGQSLTVTVTGNPGEYFGVIGSAVNSGFSYGGVPLGVGPDLVILGQGRLDGTGTATIALVPPFVGTTLELRGQRGFPVLRGSRALLELRTCVCERGSGSPNRARAGMSPSPAPRGSEPPVAEVTPVVSPA
jgi:hypothetical protein